MKNRRKKSNRHNNSQSQPLHAHRTAGKDYHERIVNIQGGTFTFNVNIGDKHQDTKTLITDVTRGVQQAMSAVAHAGEAEEWEEGAEERTEVPTQKGMDILHTPQAMKIWHKLQTAEVVDMNMKPLCTNTKASILAYAISTALEMGQLWVPFEQLWSIKNLRIYHQQAMERKYYSSTLRKFQSMVS